MPKAKKVTGRLVCDRCGKAQRFDSVVDPDTPDALVRTLGADAIRYRAKKEGWTFMIDPLNPVKRISICPNCWTK